MELTDYPVEETERGDRLGDSVDCNEQLESMYRGEGRWHIQLSPPQPVIPPRVPAVSEPVASHMTQR